MTNPQHPRPHNAKVQAAGVDWQAELLRHDRWLRTIVRARLGEPGAVDDVMQEVSLAAIKQAAPLRDTAKVAPWLYRLAVRQCLLFRRKRGRQRKLVERFTREVPPENSTRLAPDPLSWLLARERRAQVREAMQRLGQRDRELLLLKYTENWSYHQIADHLGVSHSAVESRLHRARAKLRCQLEVMEDELTANSTDSMAY